MERIRGLDEARARDSRILSPGDISGAQQECAPVIEKADARARAIVIGVVLAMVVIGVAILALGDSWRAALIAWIMHDAARSRSRAVIVSCGLAAAVILPVLGGAVYLWRFGIRVVRGRRFPPSGTWLITDTVVVQGVEAQRRGWLLQALGIGLAVTSLVFAVLFWRLIVLTTPGR
jgi:hypothetical protein